MRGNPATLAAAVLHAIWTSSSRSPRVGPGELVMTFVPGMHGHEPVADGLAVGGVAGLREDAPTDSLNQPRRRLRLGPTLALSVLVQGDYGPNNVLLDPDAVQVTAVLDWE